MLSTQNTIEMTQKFSSADTSSPAIDWYSHIAVLLSWECDISSPHGLDSSGHTVCFATFKELRLSGSRGNLGPFYTCVCVLFLVLEVCTSLTHPRWISTHVPEHTQEAGGPAAECKEQHQNCFFSQRLCFSFSPFLSRLCMFPRSPYRRTDSSFGIEVTFPPSNWLPLHQCGAGRCLRKTISRIKIIPVETSSSGRV